MPLLSRVRVLAAKIETTVGTQISLANADAAMNVMDAKMDKGIQSIMRLGQGGFSRIPAVIGESLGTCTFTTEIYGDGAGGVPTWASTLLPACGFVNSAGTFSPKSEAPGSNVKTLTIGLYENGRLKILRGAAGTAVLNYKPGRPTTISWTFTGAWVAPVDAAILTPTYPTVKPQRFESATLTIGGTTAQGFSEFSIDLGNTIEPRLAGSSAGGVHSCLITDRYVTGSFDPEAQLIATDDVYGKFMAYTEQALVINYVDSADRCIVSAPKMQRTNVADGERNGLQLDQQKVQFNRSAAAGNDELTIQFTIP